MWKHDNNLLWCLKPRKQLWHFQIGSFIWVCWLGLKPSTLSLISPWTMFLEGVVPPLSNSEVPPAPAKGQESPMAIVNKAQEWWAFSMRRLSWTQQALEPWSGPVQQTQKLMIEPKNLKIRSYLFFLVSPHHMHKHPKAGIFPYTIFTLFSWKALTAPLYCIREHVHRAEGREPGRTHGHGCMVLAWHWQQDANALSPPSSLGGEIWMILCWGTQPLPAESSRLSTALSQGMALSHQAPDCHCMTQQHVWSHVLWKITTSGASIRWDGKCMSNLWNRINGLWVNCIYTYLGMDASISLHLYFPEFYYIFCNLLLKLLNKCSKLNLEWMY